MQTGTESLKERIFKKFRKVEWEIKTLEEVATKIYYGKKASYKRNKKTGCPIVRWVNINRLLPKQFYKSRFFADKNSIVDGTYFEHGDLLISLRGDQKTVCSSCVYLGKEEGLAEERIAIVKHNQNPKYLNYCWSSEFVRNQINEVMRVSEFCFIFRKDLKKIKIPIPPMEIQNKIVEFLDKFIELERELKLELGNREEQREYYKNFIFNRSIKKLNWKLKFLKTISKEIYDGTRVRKKPLETNNNSLVRFKETYNRNLGIWFEKCDSFVNPDLVKKKRYFEYGDLIMSSVGFF